MANEGQVEISDGGTTITVNPALEFRIFHRDGFSYRDLNGKLQSADVPTQGVIRMLEVDVPIGGLTRANWTQLKDWMVGQTAITVKDKGASSTYSGSNTFKGYISNLDEGAFAQAMMGNPPYTIGIEVYEFTA